jgi:uncharacterized protein YjbI with pentapeptide repeats
MKNIVVGRMMWVIWIARWRPAIHITHINLLKKGCIERNSYQEQEREWAMSEQPQSQSNPGVAHRTMSLWDWLQLLLLPVVLVAGLLWLNIQQNQTSIQLANQQRTQALKIAQDQQQTMLVTNYMNSISDMLLHEKLLHSATIADVRVVAQAETITTLSQLDPQHKGMVIRFLMQTELINNDFRVISLRGADLRGAQLHGTDIRDTYLFGADLRGADLSGSNLSYASLSYASLAGANLSGANLQAAEMDNIDITGANLRGANLKDAQGVSDNQLAKAKSLVGAVMPDGSLHS